MVQGKTGQESLLGIGAGSCEWLRLRHIWEMKQGTHTPKVSDIFLHPLHDFSLVKESIVGGNLVSVRQKAIQPNSVVEVDYDDIIS